MLVVFEEKIVKKYHKWEDTLCKLTHNARTKVVESDQNVLGASLYQKVHKTRDARLALACGAHDEAFVYFKVPENAKVIGIHGEYLNLSKWRDYDQ